MKNIFLGIVGFFIVSYLFFFGLDIYSIQTEKNVLEKTVSQTVKDTLESQYHTGNREDALDFIEKDINATMSEKDQFTVEVKAIDLEKGLLSVLVTEEIQLFTGQKKMISAEKTAIIERMQTKEELVTVSFLVDGEVYKEFKLTKGETCPLPKPPSHIFCGWILYGSDSMETVEAVGEVWEDKTFIAVTE